MESQFYDVDVTPFKAMSSPEQYHQDCWPVPPLLHHSTDGRDCGANQ